MEPGQTARAGWSAHLLVAIDIKQVSHDEDKLNLYQWQVMHYNENIF